MSVVDDGSRNGRPGRIREGDPLEAPEPREWWEHWTVVVGAIVLGWVVVLGIIFAALALAGVGLSR